MYLMSASLKYGHFFISPCKQQAGRQAFARWPKVGQQPDEGAPGAGITAQRNWFAAPALPGSLRADAAVRPRPADVLELKMLRSYLTPR